MLAHDDIILLPMVIFFLVRQVVRGVGLFLHQIAAVFFVAQDAQNDAAAPRTAARCRDSGLI